MEKVELLERHLEEKTTVLQEKDKVIDECFPENPLATLKRKSEEFLSGIEVVPKRKKKSEKKEKKVHPTVMMGGNCKPMDRDQAAGTPFELFKILNSEFHFSFDPCPANAEFDGLQVPWGQTNFVNPPYKHCKKWVKKALEEREKGKTSVLLLPSRTGAKWFHKYVLRQPGIEVRFIQGYLTFQGYSKPAMFPSVIVIVKPVELIN